MSCPRPDPDPEALLAHTPYVRALARELVFDAALARDVEQETWLAALREAPRDPAAARGWLAAIVRNIAHKALRSRGRRSAREAEVARDVSAVPTPAEVLEREELRREVVALVNTLDEPYRGALVLRYLEGCEPKEVARRLGVPLETAKTRLKRGLEVLRARLDRTRRGGREAWCLALVKGFGLGPPGLGPLAAVAASSLLGAPSGALVLSVMKTTAVASAVLALGATLFVFVRDAESRSAPPRDGAKPDALTVVTQEVAPEGPGIPGAATALDEAPAKTPQRATAASPQEPPAAGLAVDPDVVHVAGRVLGPDGAPRAGAEVFLSRWHYDDRYPKDPLATTRTAADGGFALTYRKSDPRFQVEAERVEMWRHVTVSTYAPGTGPAWADLQRHPEGTPVELRLVPDLALSGRIVDLEGQPVSGARVQVETIGATATGSLDAFLVDPLRDEPSTYFEPLPTHTIAAETDGDGRFSLSGIGAERLVRLSLAGETITCTSVEAITRALDAGHVFARGRRLVGTGFQLAAQPTRHVVGVVRDRETGAPIVGATVMSQLMAGQNFYNSAARTTTGPDGRFRLVGMPKGAGNELCVLPPDDQPYLIAEADVPDPAGLAPVEVEVGLIRGVWITGRVTDPSGKPVYGRLHYLPYLDNPAAAALFGGRDTDSLPGAALAQHHYKTDAEGRFRLVGLPGRGIVGVETIERHRRGVGAREIGGLDEDGGLPTFSNPITASVRWPTAMRLIEPDAATTGVVCDLVVDSGATLVVELVDEAGQPVEGCVVTGTATVYARDRDHGARVEVENLGPGEQRLLRIHHPTRCIGLATHVMLGENSTKLVLRPCTTVTGRLVDEAGAGVGGVSLRAESGLHFDHTPGCQTAADGTFRFEHLVPGLEFKLLAEGAALLDRIQVLDVPVELRGGVIDLGALTVTLR